jgi:hypothetical protein
LALRVAHLNAAILMEVLNQESGHEQLALRLGTLARRIIVGEIDASIVADAMSPDIPGEVVARHGKPSRCTKKMAARSGQVGRPPRCGLLGAADPYPQPRFAVLLGRAIFLRLHASG